MMVDKFCDTDMSATCGWCIYRRIFALNVHIFIHIGEDFLAVLLSYMPLMSFLPCCFDIKTYIELLQ